MSYTKQSVRKRLQNSADEKYREFSSKLLPENVNMLGVRLPELRKLAREICKNSGVEYLRDKNSVYYEETMLEGMIIGLFKAERSVVLQLVREFIPKIDNWAVCDSFCAGLKFIKGAEEEILEFIKPYLLSDNEFEVRFGVVILLNYFVSENYIDTTLQLLEKTYHEGYYARMAIAWAVSVCYVKFPQKTFEFLTKTKMNDWVFNKSLQKITESLKVDKQSKLKIKALKR